MAVAASMPEIAAVAAAAAVADLVRKAVGGF